LPDEAAHDLLEGILLHNLDKEEKFKKVYLKRYDSLSVDPCVEDYTAFTQLVLPKIIARIARDLGYVSREHFAARYSRQAEGGIVYNLICHSFEFEPLGIRKIAKKYEPHFREIPQDEVSDELSTRVRIQAARAYEDFLPTLIQRDPQDVRASLRENADLEAELTKEAESLASGLNSTLTIA
jgi:hypothetical protein